MMNESVVDAWCIVNGNVVRKAFELSDLFEDTDGLRYYNDSYGGGAVRWSVINEPSEAYNRQIQDDLKWAKERRAWAKENAPKEIEQLDEVIASNGFMRNPVLLRKIKRENGNGVVRE